MTLLFCYLWIVACESSTMYRGNLPYSLSAKFSGECIGLFISQGNQASFFSLTCRHLSEINFFELRFSLRPGVCDEKPLGALGREKNYNNKGQSFWEMSGSRWKNLHGNSMCKVQDNRVLKHVSCSNVHCLINGRYVTWQLSTNLQSFTGVKKRRLWVRSETRKKKVWEEKQVGDSDREDFSTGLTLRDFFFPTKISDPDAFLQDE